MTHCDSIARDVQKAWGIEPRAWISVQRSVGQTLERSDVRMAEQHQVERRIGLGGSNRGIAQSAAFVGRAVRSARVGAVCGERCREIRMEPTKRAYRQRMPEQPTQHPIPFVLARAKSVAVLDARVPSSDVAEPRAESVIDTDVLSQYVATPAIVIARDHRHGHTRVRDVGECGDGSKATTRNHGAPLEPELEQIAVDHQRSGMRRHMTKKRDHRTLDFISGEAKMRVRHDVTRRLKHARILPSLRPLYKQTRPGDLRPVTNESSVVVPPPPYHDVEFRVRYAETDQMGVVYHTNYLVWCEVGRTDFIRARGMSYADMERAGIGLAVSEITARFHAAARYDDVIRVRTTLTQARSRRVVFDYVITNADSGVRLVSASTALISIDPSGRPVSLPAGMRALFAGA
jgi:acyl-CoA thioester hydrolase